ncbi:MAG: methylmalonyl-CoA mutase [Actinomycetia bacterium]|nr:methylmalonyl-CoA mutase [Actinomycetes bacterium]MCP4962336.1 methylmalonyl-CoA mutase [Actinomycetes bacterium]
MQPIRILVGMFGVDQHEVGALAVSSALSDAGMEVVYVGRFQTPERIVSTVQDEDVDVIGISCHSWEYIEYTPELLRLLAENDLTTPVVLGGSVITAADTSDMIGQGVAGVFGPSTPMELIIDDITALAAGRNLRE